MRKLSIEKLANRKQVMENEESKFIIGENFNQLSDEQLEGFVEPENRNAAWSWTISFASC